MIENGADVLYAERFGVSDAAKEQGILAIGNVIDTQAEYPDTVVASTSLAPLGTFEGKVPAEALALVEQRKAEIMSGTFTVSINDEEPTSS